MKKLLFTLLIITGIALALLQFNMASDKLQSDKLSDTDSGISMTNWKWDINSDYISSKLNYSVKVLDRDLFGRPTKVRIYWQWKKDMKDIVLLKKLKSLDKENVLKYLKKLYKNETYFDENNTERVRKRWLFGKEPDLDLVKHLLYLKTKGLPYIKKCDSLKCINSKLKHINTLKDSGYFDVSIPDFDNKFEILIGFKTATITLSKLGDGAYTNNPTPDFQFTVTGNETDYSCELFINDTGYGVETAQNNTLTTITANTSLSEGTYYWYINCTKGGITNQSSTWHFTVDLTSPNLTFQNPTEGNNSYIPHNFTEINISISENYELNSFKFNWNSTDYRFYDDSLVLALNFNNNSAIGENDTKAVDISQYGNNGTIHGATWTTGKFGSALEFDGTDDYVEVPDDDSIDVTNEITLEAWMKPLDDSPNMVVGKAGAYIFAFSPDYNKKRLYFNYHNGSNWVGATYSNTQITDFTKFYHVAATYSKNSGVVRIFINGELDKTNDVTADEIATSAASVEIGRVWPDWRFNGTIDEVRIYNRALTPEEIRMHYLSEFQKYNSTQYRFYNNITDLTDGTYTYYGWANDTVGNEGQTETRILNVKEGFYELGISYGHNTEIGL